MMVDSDINVNIAGTERNHREEEIAVSTVTTGMEGMSTQLLPQHKSWEQYGRAW